MPSAANSCHFRYRAYRSGAAVLVMLAAVVLAAGCGTSSGQAGAASPGSQASHAISFDGYTIHLEGAPRVAFFTPFLGNAAIQTVDKTVAAIVAKTPGAMETVFDANGSELTQVNQMQDIIRSKAYNIAFVVAANPVLECKILSQDMPTAGILVGIYNPPIWDAWSKEGAQLRAPGTFAFVGGTHAIDYYYDYYSWIAAQNPGPQKVIDLTGPQLNPVIEAADIALKRVEADHPGFKVVDEIYTQAYGVPESYTDMQTAIQAHPDATMLIGGYSTATEGAVEVLRSAGKLGKIKIYDKGGDVWATNAVKDGIVEATTPEAQVTSAVALIQALMAGATGKLMHPVAILHDGIKLVSDKYPSGLEIFTKSNIAEWTPQVP